ncbi:hypothetical protein Tco_0511220 [Tanacetum coccineum]
MGLPTTHPDEGISTTKPLLEGTNTRPKDSGRLKPLADKDSSTSPVTVLSRTLDCEPLKLTTMADIQALLINSEDELKEASDDDVFEAGEEMDEDIQEPETEETQTHHSIKTPTEEPHSQENQSPSPPKEQPESSKAKETDASDSGSSFLYAQVAEDHWDKHEEAAASYVDFKAAVDGYYDENIDHRA